jgi:hypothetical protein
MKYNMGKFIFSMKIMLWSRGIFTLMLTTKLHEGVSMHEYTMLPHHIFCENYVSVKIVSRRCSFHCSARNCVVESKGANIHTMLPHHIQL